MAYSDGSRQLHRQPASKRLAARLKRCQRKLARQRKGSNRRQRTRGRLQRLHRRIRNVGNTWRHRLSRGIANRARLLVLEKLNTRGVTSSGKGTVEQPGVNIRARAGLNRSILATVWAELEQMLSYKTRVVYVDPAYTSQTCARCGHVDKVSRQSRSVFRCTSCGHRDNADLNAAQSILASGIGATARREAFPSGTSTTREIAADALMASNA